MCNFFLETCFFYVNDVIADGKRQHLVEAVFVCNRIAAYACGGVGDRYLGAGNHRSAGIGDRAQNFSVVLLGYQHAGKHAEQQKCEREPQEQPNCRAR